MLNIDLPDIISEISSHTRNLDAYRPVSIVLNKYVTSDLVVK